MTSSFWSTPTSGGEAACVTEELWEASAAGTKGGTLTLVEAAWRSVALRVSIFLVHFLGRPGGLESWPGRHQRSADLNDSTVVAWTVPAKLTWSRRRWLPTLSADLSVGRKRAERVTSAVSVIMLSFGAWPVGGTATSSSSSSRPQGRSRPSSSTSASADWVSVASIGRGSMVARRRPH